MGRAVLSNQQSTRSATLLDVTTKGQALAPNAIENGIEYTPQHYYTRIHVGNKSKGCSVIVDDGFFGDLIHDEPFPLPDNADGFVDQPDPTKTPPGQTPTGTIIPKV